MEIRFSDTNLAECQAAYNLLDPEARLAYSQYDFAKNTEIKDPTRWIDFLKHPSVSQIIEEELMVFAESQRRKLIQRSTTHDKSVGTAQMINALGKVNEEEGKTGTPMIYCYVPLNESEMQAPGIQILHDDVFDKEKIYEYE